VSSATFAPGSKAATWIKRVYLAIYVVVLLTGVASFVTVPAVMQSNVGDLLSRAWSCMFVSGAILALVSLPRGWWLAERWAIVVIDSGAVFYLAVVLYSDWSNPGSEVMQIGVTVLAALLFWPVRWLMICDFEFEPRPERGWT